VELDDLRPLGLIEVAANGAPGLFAQRVERVGFGHDGGAEGASQEPPSGCSVTTRMISSMAGT
jgi:hypothetical protein